MTIAEVRDAFVADYKVQSQLRGMKELELPAKIIASWISRGQQEVADRLAIMIAYEDISLTAVSVYTEYNLDSKFGGFYNAEIAGLKVDEANIKDIDTTGSLMTGTPNKIAIIHDGSQNAYKAILEPLPSSSLTLRLWYYVNTLFYSPSAAAAQDWGTFDGKAWTGDLKIPDRYLEVIILYLMAKVFPDMKGEYEHKIRSFKSRNVGSARAMNYRFGI